VQTHALVVFTDQRQVPWLAWLRPGFRHCFVVVRDPDGEWVACDWLMGRLAFRVYGPQDPAEIVSLFLAAGHRVVEVRTSLGKNRGPWLRPMSCVEVAKQAIGRGGWRPFTPFGLFRVLRREGHRTYGD
jgi:hypothetical protein